MQTIQYIGIIVDYRYLFANSDQKYFAYIIINYKNYITKYNAF